MKYAVIKNVNGSFSLDSESNDLKQEIVRYHAVCSTLWNSEDVNTASVEIIDELGTPVPNYREIIRKDVQS